MIHSVWEEGLVAGLRFYAHREMKKTNKQNETNVSTQTRKQPSETINISGNSDIAADLALIINNTPDVQYVPILQLVNVEFLKR